MALVFMEGNEADGIQAELLSRCMQVDVSQSNDAATSRKRDIISGGITHVRTGRVSQCGSRGKPSLLNASADQQEFASTELRQVESCCMR